MRTTRGAGPAAVALTALLTAPAAASTAPDALRVEVADAALPGLGLLVTVPPELARRPLRADAFRLVSAGEAVPVEVRRVVEESEFVVVVDTAVEPAEVAAAQGVATELLRALPPRVATAVLPPTGGRARPAYDGGAALASVAALRPEARPEVADEVVRTVQGWGAPARRRTLHLLTTCDALLAGRWAPGPLLPGDQQLNVIASGTGCQDEADDAVRPTGGVARLGADLGQLTEAADAGVRDLLGQYELRAQLPGPPARLQVRLTDRGQALTGDVVLPEPTSAPGVEPERDPLLLIGAAALLGLLVLAVPLVVMSRR